MTNATDIPTHFKYDRHDEEWEKCLSDPDTKKIALTWLQADDTFDRWRHNRMYALLSPLIKADLNASWLTVGDGRYGTDANALLRMNLRNIHCSDISDKLLKIGAEQGFIKEFSAQNAESLGFQDNSFDYVLCKEAYHHLPRPHIALHEMFRVARKAVILIEPRDQQIDRSSFNFFLKVLNILRGKGSNDSYGFEPVGNFVFSLSERECEKILLGMNKRFVAFNGINDVYESGVEFLKLTTTDQTERRWIRKLKFKLKCSDLLTKLRIRKSGLMHTILFKVDPDTVTLNALREFNWKVKKLPLNPYA